MDAKVSVPNTLVVGPRSESYRFRGRDCQVKFTLRMFPRLSVSRNGLEGSLDALRGVRVETDLRDRILDFVRD